MLSCADSRVPVEILFDQSIGHLFVNRVAGNIATSEIIASMEYGVAVLTRRGSLVKAAVQNDPNSFPSTITAVSAINGPTSPTIMISR